MDDIFLSPTPGTVLISPIPPTQSDIHIATKPGKVQEGIVLAVGENPKTDYGIEIPSPVHVGDHVAFLSYESGLDLFIYQGMTYHIVLFNDIRGVFNGK